MIVFFTLVGKNMCNNISFMTFCEFVYFTYDANSWHISAR